MFEELLRRIPDWRIAPGAEPRILPSAFARGYDEVPIEFTPGLTDPSTCPGHRHALDAVDEAGVQHRRLAGDLDVGQAPEQLAEHHRDLAPGQVRAEAEVRAAGAEADVLVRRRAARRTGTGPRTTASSRLAELYQITTLSPAAIGCPPISVSAVAVRRKWITGDAHRTISSTAVGATPSKSASQTCALVGVVA